MKGVRRRPKVEARATTVIWGRQGGDKLGVQGCDRNDAELDDDPETRRRSRHQPPKTAWAIKEPTARGGVGGWGGGREGRRARCDARTGRALWCWDGTQWVLLEMRLALRNLAGWLCCKTIQLGACPGP